MPIDVGQMTTQEFRVRWPDGQWRWLASRSMTVHDKDEGRTRRIGVNWDVTDARTAQLAHQERAAVILQSQAKSQFLSRMSHELRTPLNAVLGFSQLMLADGERASAATRKRRLEQILTAGRHLLALIDDVLDLSSLEGGEMRVGEAPVALQPLVDESLALVERQARQKKLKLRAGGAPVVAMADATRLRQVLLNLLTTAVKYNVDGGSVSVSTALEAPWVVLSVNDTGRGMSPDQLIHAFEPFNRLGLERGAIEGTGIGLSIVKALVERMHGQVRVHSKPNEGTVFEVRLPDASLSGPAPAAPEDPPILPPAQPPSVRGGRLLYIEDNAVNQLIVQELVALRPDLSLVCADSGLAGTAMAFEQPPDLILVDMQLPDIDGHEVLRRLRSNPRTADIRCIAVSANALPADIARARRCGFADYWTKPLDFTVFMAGLDNLFGPTATT
jgi:signal transduction histidine kinase